MLLGVRTSLGISMQKWAPSCGMSGAIWVCLTTPGSAVRYYIGVCYLPPAQSPQLKLHSVSRRLAALAREVAHASTLGHVILGGDFNAKVGQWHDPYGPAAGLPPRGATSKAVDNHGKQLVEFCDATDLVLCTGSIPGDESAHNTWARGNCRPSRLDHLLASHDAVGLIRSCHVRQGSNRRYDSDHQPLEITLQLQHGVSAAPLQPPGQRMRHIVWKVGHQAAYAEALGAPISKRLLQLSQQASTAGDVTAADVHITAAILKSALTDGARRTPAAFRKCPRGQGSHDAPFFDAECRAAHKRYCAARRGRPGVGDCQAAESAYRQLVRRKRRLWTTAQLNKHLGELKHDQRALYKRFNRTRKTLPMSLRSPSSWDSFRHKLASYQPPLGRHLPVDLPVPHFDATAAAALNNPSITAAEVLSALQKLHNGRASGASEYPAECLRYAFGRDDVGCLTANALVASISPLFSAAFANGTVPDSWNTALITPIYKKGDKIDTSNYRPVAVGSPLARLYAIVLDRRVSQYCEQQRLRADCQAGFRPQRSVNHNLFALQHAIDKSRRAKNNLHTCFVDLTAAFDRIPRHLLWQRLQSCGIEGPALAAIQSLYEKSEVAINLNGCVGTSEATLCGVKQGCPLSPTLFGLFIDALEGFLAVRAPAAGLRIRRCMGDSSTPQRRLSALIYADDIVLLSETPQQLQLLLDALAEFCSSVGLSISRHKTSVMTFKFKRARQPTAANQNTPAVKYRFGSIDLEEVQQYTYLGVSFSCSGNPSDYTQHAKDRVLAANHTMRRQYNNLECGESLQLQLQFFDAIVSSTASYAGELWGLHPRTKQACAALESVHSKCLKDFVRVPRGTCTADVYFELGVKSLRERWLTASLRFWNQLAALPAGDLYRDILFDSMLEARESTHTGLGFVGGLRSACHAIGFELEVNRTQPQRLDVATILALADHRQEISLNDHTDICPRTCPSQGASRCTYVRWFRAFPEQLKRGSIYNLGVPVRKLRQLLRFRLGCHHLPIVVGRRNNTPRGQRICQRCHRGLGDEKHLVFECSSLDGLRSKFRHLFRQDTNTMRSFMNQPAQKDVLDFVVACNVFDSRLDLRRS